MSKRTVSVWTRLDAGTVAALDLLAAKLRRQDPLVTRADAVRVAISRGLSAK